MGEKSFDHSKKFLFNKLRRRFHLNEAPQVKTAIPITPIASQADPIESPTMPFKPGFTPRFKAGLEKTPQIEAGEITAVPPIDKPIYKPRFVAKKSDPEHSELPADKVIEPEKVDKPSGSYRPKFSMKNIGPKKEE